ncbi:MAG: SctD/MshK family protein, partial [Steroidobacteraceae bacterium]
MGTDSSVSASRLPVIVTAIRRGRNAGEGYVDLGVNRTSPQTYRAGAILANGARIEEIHSDYLVLERDGQRARVYLEGHRPIDDHSAESALLFVGGTQPSPPALPNSRD